MTKKLAIIDDEAEMEFIYRMIFEEHLKRNLLELHFFESGRPFLHWLKVHSPDLILTDIHMPDLSGPQLVEKIRSAGHGTDVYFVSGDEPSLHGHIMRALDVKRYIGKPLDFAEVLKIVESDLALTPSFQ